MNVRFRISIIINLLIQYVEQSCVFSSKVDKDEACGWLEPDQDPHAHVLRWAIQPPTLQVTLGARGAAQVT